MLFIMLKYVIERRILLLQTIIITFYKFQDFKMSFIL